MKQRKLTVKHDYIAFAHAIFPQSSGKNLHLVQQLTVCKFLLGLSDRAIKIDGNLVTMASLDMPVNAVIARGDLAVRKPLPAIVLDAALELLGRELQDRAGLLVPEEMLGLVGPELLGILQAVPQDVILDVAPLSRHGASVGEGQDKRDWRLQSTTSWARKETPNELPREPQTVSVPMHELLSVRPQI
jgi:hypothetical protein